MVMARRITCLLLLWAAPAGGFSPSLLAGQRPAFVASTRTTTSSTTLFLAKKKKTPASAALDQLEALDALDDEPLSKKELQQLEKQKQKAEKAAAASVEEAPEAPKLSKKEAKLQKALELEQLEAEATDDTPQPSKKELKALKRKEAAGIAPDEPAVNGEPETTPESDTTPAPVSKKLSKKEAKLQKALELEQLEADDETTTPQLSKKELKALKRKEAAGIKTHDKPVVNGDAATVDEEEPILSYNDEKDVFEIDGHEDDSPPAPVETKPEKATLEDRIRKDRPPPRIRVMESSQPGYTSLRLENIGITFRNQQVLRDVTWGVQTGDRIGLVGANGAGKTTQLRILAGEMEPTVGDVVKSSNNVRVAMLRQEFIDELVPEQTLQEEFMSVFEEENQILLDLKTAEKELEDMPPDETDKMQEILDRMQELQNKAENKGVYALESRVKKTMDLMGFTSDEAEDLVASFSGGWKMRIGLGKVLLKDPNVLLLDEPTNHLDLESVEWLEAFLKEQNIPMVIVSHDREFLDQVCTKIVDAEGGICTEYDGNYSRFLQLKKARLDSWQAAYNAQEKKMKEERQWIQKFKVKQPQAVKQRQAKLDKLVKSDDYVQKPPFVGKPFRFRFPDAPRLSPEVAEVKGMSHVYRSEQSQNRLFDDVELFVEKGDRIAVVGPNGSGKSTLLRLLIGKEQPVEGTAEIVGQNVDMNYFEQNQADALDLDKTVLETIQGASSDQSYNELRALLGQFLFKGDAVEKKVQALSGGEKARLSLCCMMLKPANLLILDEPTNHLDIPAKEMLEEALQHFDGSVVVVSHDRFFISQVANTIVAIEDRKLVKYQGDYRFYMERSKEFKEKIESRYVAGAGRIESAPVIDLEEIQRNAKKKSFGGAKNANMVQRKNKGIKNAKRMQEN